MLNPSTADAFHNDPTIRRCIGFARAWGYDGIEVVNLFSWRATNPKEVLAVLADAANSQTDKHIFEVGLRCEMTVAAWGATRWAEERAAEVYRMLRHTRTQVTCVGRTKSGAPRHPLYVKANTMPTSWAPR